MRKYLLEIIVFTTGMGIMVFELVGSRVLAPYVGTTIMVWSALIGVILAFLSAGYFWGGKIADRKADYKTLSWIVFGAGCLVGLTGFIKLPVINFLEAHFNDFRWEAVFASLLLFGPGSFFMAAVSPYAVRLRLSSPKDSGEVVGRLYAVSTIGSIVGAFLTGMVLIPYFGSTKIIFSLSAVLFLAAIVTLSQRGLKAKVVVTVFAIAWLPFTNKIDYHFLPLNFVHSAYMDFALVPGSDVYNDSGRPVLQVFTGPTTIQSAMFTDQDNELVLPYTRFFRYASEFLHPNAKSALVIGGGAYSFPKDILKENSEVKVDVVEIDPKMTQIAKEKFNVKDDPRLTSYNEDGRTFLNRNQKKYDEIFVDSFRTYVAPFQLTTLETAQKINNSLTDKGIVLVNMIQSINGVTGRFFRAEYATYKKVFPQIYIFTVADDSPDVVGNIIMVASKNPERITLKSQDEVVQSYIVHHWDGEVANDMPEITDDFAPVADYMLAASRTIKHNN